jgi:hypothetical protein
MWSIRDERLIVGGRIAAQTLEVALPALAVRRIREHEIELASGKRVIRQRRVLRTADDVVGRIAFAFEKQVSFADGVRLRVDLLAIKASGERSFSISVPSASAFESRGSWLRNSKLSRMSCTFGENPSR